MNILRRLINGRPSGAFVEVFLDYGFGKIEEGGTKYKPTFEIEKLKSGCLYITDISPTKAKKELDGMRFDWHLIHSHWRYHLEIDGYHKVIFEDVKKYLIKEKK